MTHPDELLDVVDEHNRVVRQASRQEVHEKGWLHRSAHLILVSPNHHFLLQQRAHSRPTHPDKWDSSAAGHVAAGDSFDETMAREAREEIGFSATPIPLLLIEGSPETDFEWIQFYVQEVTAPPKLQPDADEVADLRWWGKEELTAALVNQPELFTPAFSILFFLWRQTNFLVPTRQQDGWYLISHDEPDRGQVQRALLESAGLRARVSGDYGWVDPRGGQPLFGGRNQRRTEGLRVPLEELPEAVALLYLSEPVEEDDEIDRST